MNCKDGWPLLRATYGLSEAQVRGLDHDIAYKGLAEGKIDVVDLYTTDPEIALYDLKLLDDDRGVFSDNEALLLYRADLSLKAPKALEALLKMQGRIAEAAMIAMNKAVKIERRSEDETAARFVQDTFGIVGTARPESLSSKLLARTLEHLRLVLLSLGPAILVSIPLGVLAFRRPMLGQVILALASVLQTIPHSRCSSSCCLCSASGRPRRSRRCSSTACCRSFGTRPPDCRAFRHPSAIPPLRLD